MNDPTEREALRFGRLFRQFLLGLLGAPRTQPRRDFTVSLRFGRAIGANDPYNPEDFIMAEGNIGQRIPVQLEVLKEDGSPASIDGAPVWEIGSPEVLELREVDGASFLYLLSRGESTVTVTVDADLGEGVRELMATGQVIVNDPHGDEAQIINLNLGAAEDVPA